MSDEEKKKFKRKPLSRSRRLGSRRRKKGEEAEAAGEEGGGETAAAEAPAEEAEAAPDPEATKPVNAAAATARIPGPAGSGTPALGALPPPPAERMAKIKGSVRRFTVDFSKFLFGLGQTAHQSGQAFGHNVVKPFSHALVEAAISLAILFVTGVAGLYAGRYLKLTTSKVTNTVVIERQTVQPTQNMDESFFSEGFKADDFKKRATKALSQYLDALKGSDYKTAYAQLSKDWQGQLSYPAFETGYRQARVNSYDIGRSEAIDSSHIRLHAELSVTEKGENKVYQANYLLVLTSNGWKLDGGAFQ